MMGWVARSFCKSDSPGQHFTICATNSGHSYLETPSTLGSYCSFFHNQSIFAVLNSREWKKDMSNDSEAGKFTMSDAVPILFLITIQWVVPSSKGIITHLPGSSASEPRIFFWQGQETTKSYNQRQVSLHSVIGKLIRLAGSRGHANNSMAAIWWEHTHQHRKLGVCHTSHQDISNSHGELNS